MQIASLWLGMDKLAELSKTDLLKRAQGLTNSISRQRNLAKAAGEKIETLVGNVTAGAVGFGIGYIETAIRNKDGTPMSLGPVPLALAVGTSLSLVSMFWNPANQVSSASCGAIGAYGATMGRGFALKQAEKKTGQKVSGDAIIGAWNDAKSDLING